MSEDAATGGSPFAEPTADRQRTEDRERLNDSELLHRYAGEKSEAAFAELVRRHLDLVYAVALRQVGGDAHLAEDVAQTVFTALARKAAELAARPVLGGWLYRTTQFAAIDVVRAESRRRAREAEAQTMHEFTTNPGLEIDWEKLRPTLDQAIGELPVDDRDAVVLRFFEGRSFADVGARLRLTENTARMRVERALDKLHALLARRGVTSTTAALGVALVNQVGGAAPAGLAASVAGAALAGAAGGVSFMSTAKVLVGAAIVAGLAAIGVATNQARAARATRAEIAAIGDQQEALQARLRAAESSLAAAERRAQAADADATQLLKAVQDASPKVGLPPGDVTCIAFVIDTSGSMRDPNTNRLWPVVHRAINEALAAHPDARFVMGFDSSGRNLFGGANGWLPRTPEALGQIEETLRRYDEDSVSNPTPGIYRAMRAMPPPSPGGPRLHVCVIGDEFNSGDQAEAVVRRLEQLNPTDARGNRRATISAIQLPTTIRYLHSMGNTGVRFQSLMTEVARQHAGTYQLLPVESLETK